MWVLFECWASQERVLWCVWGQKERGKGSSIRGTTTSRLSSTRALCVLEASSVPQKASKGKGGEHDLMAHACMMMLLDFKAHGLTPQIPHSLSPLHDLPTQPPHVPVPLRPGWLGSWAWQSPRIIPCPSSASFASPPHPRLRPPHPALCP